MEAEAKIIIVFLFNRSGKTALKASELYLPLSMELGWFSTAEAQAFVSYALSQGLLIEQDGMLHPGFPVETVTIPVGFTPRTRTYSAATEKPEKNSVIDNIIAVVSEKSGRKKSEILEEITRIASEKHIFPEVAALLVARNHGFSFDPWYDTVESLRFRENTA